jgi:hypothetical protein
VARLGVSREHLAKPRASLSINITANSLNGDWEQSTCLCSRLLGQLTDVTAASVVDVIRHLGTPFVVLIYSLPFTIISSKGRKSQEETLKLLRPEKAKREVRWQ